MRALPHILGLLALALVALPVAALLWIALLSPGDGADWGRLFAYVLPQTLHDTVLLLLGVGTVTALVGTGTAWLTAAYSFPGRGLASALLVLPLTVPTYVAAYAWVEITDYAGPLQTAIRDWGGRAGAYPFPDIRSLPGAVLVLSSVLYPYVFLTARVAFALGNASALEAARTLGASASEAFRLIALPAARPAIVAGVSLALMETLNDIGAVETLGVRTVTFTIYDTWLSRGSLSGAAQLAAIMLVLVVGLLWLERRHHRARSSVRERPLTPRALPAGRGLLALAACLAVPAIGFGVPASLLAAYALRRVEDWGEPALVAAAGGSVTLAASVALATVAGVYLLLQGARLGRAAPLRWASRATTFGYAVPGTVMAIGVLLPLAALDNAVDGWARLHGFSTGLLLTGSLAALVYACALRFAAIAHGAVDAGFGRISPSVDGAARTLGERAGGVAWRVHLPMLRPALLTAGLLVFVDTMKELPATLLMRPFGFETLATLIYARAGQGDFEDAAFAGLIVVAIGMVPLLLTGLVSRLAVVLAKKKAGPSATLGPAEEADRMETLRTR